MIITGRWENFHREYVPSPGEVGFSGMASRFFPFFLSEFNGILHRIPHSISDVYGHASTRTPNLPMIVEMLIK